MIPDLDDDLLELIQWLKQKPMETLMNSYQCVEQVIDFSFQKLSDKDQKSLVCLSVFHGDFQSKSAEEVIEENWLKAQHILRNLVNRSLLQRRSDKRFVIHSLSRRFLTDGDQFHDEKVRAKSLMVNNFLKMCHSLTMVLCTRSGFTSAKNHLKRIFTISKKRLKSAVEIRQPN